LEISGGLKILLDPFHEESVGYPLPSAEADIVMISHNHMDHNNIAAAGRNAQVILGPGEHRVMGLQIIGIGSYHDEKRGRLRGENTIFCFELDGIRVCHLGDLGHKLGMDQIKEIGCADLLFIPVGGLYTINAKVADEVMMQLRPRLAVPMHYRTKALAFDLDSVDDFLEGRKDVERQVRLHLAREDLSGEGRVAVLSCPAAEGSADR
jgi:L-ascorbate metabolism protein UlaG (beta-lactamase superfamily)